jgi:hypothetical protein
MGINQISLDPAQQEGKRAGTFITSCTVMVCSAIAIAFVLASWALGGFAYLHSFYGDFVLGILVACFFISASMWRSSRIPER